MLDNSGRGRMLRGGYTTLPLPSDDLNVRAARFRDYSPSIANVARGLDRYRMCRVRREALHMELELGV